MNTTTQTKPTKATRLQTAIVCNNFLNSITKDLIVHTKKQLDYQIGKDTFKINGSFLKKVHFNKLDLPQMQVSRFGFDFWVQSTYYLVVNKYRGITISINVTVSGGGYDKNGVNMNHHSNERCISLYDVKEGTITKALDVDMKQFETVFDEKEILILADKIEEAKTAYNKVLDLIPYQFKGVLYIKNL